MADKAAACHQDSVDAKGGFPKPRFMKKKKKSESGDPSDVDVQGVSIGNDPSLSEPILDKTEDVNQSQYVDHDKKNESMEFFKEGALKEAVTVEESKTTTDAKGVDEKLAPSIRFSKDDYAEYLKKSSERKASTLLNDLKKKHAHQGHSAYNMQNAKRGTAIIFNIGKFEANTHMPERKGYLLDGHMMRQVFVELGFDVKYHEDLDSKAIKEILDNESQQPHKDEDCFVGVIMTHGEPSPKGQDLIYATNGPVNLQLLIENFNAQNCPSLAGKPKLFFVQACRGSQTDAGAITDVETDAATKPKTKVIPVESDILLSQSTVPGFFSFRNQEKGSVYIRYLACTLGLHGAERDIHWILTEVNSLVANEFTSSADRIDFNMKKQMPVFTSMLTKQLILTPKPKPKTETTL